MNLTWPIFDYHFPVCSLYLYVTFATLVIFRTFAIIIIEIKLSLFSIHYIIGLALTFTFHIHVCIFHAAYISLYRWRKYTMSDIHDEDSNSISQSSEIDELEHGYESNDTDSLNLDDDEDEHDRGRFPCLSDRIVGGSLVLHIDQTGTPVSGPIGLVSGNQHFHLLVKLLYLILSNHPIKFQAIILQARRQVYLIRQATTCLLEPCWGTFF